MSKLTSGRVKKLPQSGLTSDRYEFLGLNQAEPDLGDPIIGVSSIVAKPYPPGTQYVMINVGGDTGSRYWIDSNNLNVGDLSPGAFTIFNNDVQIGLANSFTTFNFVGTGVTVDFVGPSPEEQTGIATVRIAVVDVLAPGDDYQIPYHDPITGFLRGASGFAFRPDRNESVGIGTELTNINYKLDVIGNAGISSTLYVDEIDVNFIDALDINVGTVTFTSGVGTNLSITNDTTISGDLSVGAGGTVFKTENSYVGIGSTQPQHKLDIDGDVKLGGLVYDFTGSPGTLNQVLLSTGSSTPPSWGGVTNLTIGNAERVDVVENDTDQIFPIGFATGYAVGQSNFGVDSDFLVYNPGTNRLGIGTADPQYDLHVPGIVRAGQIIVNSITDAPDVVNTTSFGEAILDQFSTTSFRSTRYTIQTTVTGQIREGSASIASTTVGQSYVLGNYTDVPIITVTGVGTGALANITVETETSPITASEDGVFTTSNDITGVVQGTSVAFDQLLEPTDAEQSKLTSITVTNAGAGFTDIPNIVIDSPITVGNPVDGVEPGVAAVVTGVEMEVTNVVLNETGVSTSSIPTTTFSTPTSGSAAQGYVGFGVSTFTVTQPGAAYTESPIVNYDQTPTVTPVTQVGLGISDANIQIFGGSGYNSGVTTITVDPPVGGGVTATMILGSTDGSAITSIQITNVGSGYTQIPGVTVTNDGSGVGAAITITEMIVTNIDVTSVGSGFATSKPVITFTGGGGGAGVAATVTDIEITSIEVSSAGAGYTASDMPVTATIPVIDPENFNISVTNSGASDYLLTGSDRSSTFTSAADPTITFKEQDTIEFNVNASGHPFYIKTTPGTGTGNQVPGVINNGAQVGIVTWTPTTEGTYYYQCSVHGSMVGTINVTSASGVGHTVALGIVSVNSTEGIGYTVAPGFTIDAPTVAPFTGAAFTSALGYGPEFNILPGPGYGGTTVYYIQGIDSSTFRVATDVGFTDIIELGYDISLNPNAYIGGSISTITITEKGSGYANGDVLTASNTDLSSPVGTGFTFAVDNLIESYQVSDLLLLQASGSAVEEASVVEYAGIGNVENLGDYDADITGPNARLKFTPNYAFNTIKISRKGIAP